MKPDYYRVLGVDRCASTQAIHRAWREAARDRHPDRRLEDSKDKAAAMALANEAWAVLGDREARRAYDVSLRVPEPPQVQEAILAAARTVLLGGGAPDVGDGSGDFTVVRESVRVGVRSFPTLDGETLRAGLASAVIDQARCADECIVLLACRVLDPDDARLRLERMRVPRVSVVAIDLMESCAYGEFPSATVWELFRVFLEG